MITRQSHLAWCRARAYDFVRRGEVRNAIYSLVSDLSKHDDTQARHAAARDQAVELLQRKHLETEHLNRWIYRLTECDRDDG